MGIRECHSTMIEALRKNPLSSFTEHTSAPTYAYRQPIFSDYGGGVGLGTDRYVPNFYNSVSTSLRGISFLRAAVIGLTLLLLGQ